MKYILPDDLPDPSEARAYVLHAVKHFLGNDKFRGELIEEWLRNELGQSQCRHILIGPTFGSEIMDEAALRIGPESSFEDRRDAAQQHILDFVTTIISADTPSVQNRLVLFTAINVPDADSGETHYQSFIIDTRNRCVIAIDPARRACGAPGVQAAFTAEAIQAHLATRYPTWGFAFIINRGGAWQRDYGDTFCQTWSLLLLISAVTQFYRAGGDWSRVEFCVPAKMVGRQEILTAFLRHLASLRVFQKYIPEQYREVCDEEPHRLLKYDPWRRLNVVDTLAGLNAEQLVEYRRENLRIFRFA